MKVQHLKNSWINEGSEVSLSQSVIIEVFKTDVQGREKAENLIEILCKSFPESKINFDLQDCDRILCVEGSNFLPERIINLLQLNGFGCEILY
jgi:hypothetical protein